MPRLSSLTMKALTVAKAIVTIVSNIAVQWSAATEQARIEASDVALSDYFGRAVSISSDGNTAIVGSHLEDTGAGTAGSAYIYVRSGSTWTEQAKIQASDWQSKDQFGISVSMSGDGNTAIVGAHFEDTGGSAAGSAYIFTRSGSTWTEQAKIQASDAEASDRFGWSVALSDDGNTVIVAAYLEDGGAPDGGSAYIFTRAGSTWSQQAKLLASDAEASDDFGYSVALSGDGNTAIVGAYFEDTGGANAGAAYIYTRSGSTWTEQAKIQSSDIQAGDQFGISVSMSGDGNTAIVGANFEDAGGSQAGAAYVYTRSGSTWTEQAKIQSSDIQASDYVGWSVSISSDGNTAIVAAVFEGTLGAQAGAAYIFTRSGSTWTEQVKILASGTEASDNFGTSAYISGDATTAIVGSPLDGTGGAAYIFAAG